MHRRRCRFRVEQAKDTVNPYSFPLILSTTALPLFSNQSQDVQVCIQSRRQPCAGRTESSKKSRCILLSLCPPYRPQNAAYRWYTTFKLYVLKIPGHAGLMENPPTVSQKDKQAVSVLPLNSSLRRVHHPSQALGEGRVLSPYL